MPKKKNNVTKVDHKLMFTDKQLKSIMVVNQKTNEVVGMLNNKGEFYTNSNHVMILDFGPKEEKDLKVDINKKKIFYVGEINTKR